MKKPELIDNIREMWGLMLKDSREQAIEIMVSEFGFAERTMKQVWIWGANMPDKYQPRVVEIFQKILAIQIQNTQKKIEI